MVRFRPRLYMEGSFSFRLSTVVPISNPLPGGVRGCCPSSKIRAQLNRTEPQIIVCLAKMLIDFDPAALKETVQIKLMINIRAEQIATTIHAAFSSKSILRPALERARSRAQQALTGRTPVKAARCCVREGTRSGAGIANLAISKFVSIRAH